MDTMSFYNRNVDGHITHGQRDFNCKIALTKANGA